MVMSASSLPTELRLALCMRGGVSLAVWMGGACREIAALRSALGDFPTAVNERDAAQRAVYRRILGLARYKDVTIDVIAGTSAGGLNGALLTTHLVHGMRFDNGIRDIWLRLGDVESLTRHPGRGPAPSLLNGDDEFYGRLAEQLRLLVAKADPVPAEKVPRLVRLILTATRVFARSQHIRTSVGDPLLACSSQAHVTFRHHQTFDGVVHPIFTDLPADSATHLDRLAYAARATSSFPGAFEPARITVTDSRVVDLEPWRNLFGLSSDTGIPDAHSDQVQLMDGGVLDNIPLAWAVRAIASAPAGAPVDRWLLYLQPVPPAEPQTPAWRKQPDSLARLLLTIKSFLRTKLNSESLLDDHAELSDAWTSAQRLHGATGGLPGDPGQDQLPRVSQELVARYAESVAHAEADRLARLIEDPIGLIGPDPLPIPENRAFPDGAVQGRVLKQLRGRALPEIVIPEVVLRKKRRRIRCVHFRSPLAPARAVALALDWVQAVEDKAQWGDRPPRIVRLTREALYDTRFACEVLLAARDRLLLHGAAQTAVGSWVSSACDQLHRLIDGAGGLTTDYEKWPSVLATVAAKSTQPFECTDPSATWPDEPFAAIWKRVAHLCRQFGSQLEGTADVTGFHALYEAAIADAYQDRTVRTRRVLAIAEILLGPLRPDPLSEPTRIQVHAMSGTARSPLESILITTDRPRDDLERVNRKLSGNKLMNFASFLSSRWRLNDWTWGRLDAACSLIEVLTRCDRVQNTSDGELVEWLRNLYEDQYVAVFGDTSNDLDAHPELTGLIGPWKTLGITETNVRRRLPALLVTWLHWNVLRQEIPLLTYLNSLPNDRDLPPTSQQLRAAGETSESMLSVRAEELGATGGESIRALLRKEHLRRTGMRLGLVAWRSLRPAAKSVTGFLLRALMAALKPVVLIPLLIGFLTPVPTLFSSIFAWCAVAVATDSWLSTPTHYFVATGSAASMGYIAWHYWTTRSGKARRWLVMSSMAAAFAGLVTLGSVLRARVPVPFGDESWTSLAALGTLSALAVLASVWGVLGRRIKSHRLRRFGFMVGVTMTPGLTVALTTYLITQYTRWDPWPIGSWWATFVLYLTLAAETLVLTYFYPLPPKPPGDDATGADASIPSSRAPAASSPGRGTRPSPAFARRTPFWPTLRHTGSSPGNARRSPAGRR